MVTRMVTGCLWEAQVYIRCKMLIGSAGLGYKTLVGSKAYIGYRIDISFEGCYTDIRR